MPTTYFYIDEWTDEVLPCEPTLEGWAAWLAKDVTEDWGREGAVADGSEFQAGRLTDLGTIALVKDADGEWYHSDAIPDGTTSYFARYAAHDTGWDAEFSGDTIDAALTEWEDDTAFLACVRDDCSVRLRFDAQGPRLIVLGEVN